MSEPRQFRRDPATGGFCEDRLAESPLPCKVCDKCSGYYVGECCETCEDDTDIAPTQPDPPDMADPPGGSD